MIKLIILKVLTVLILTSVGFAEELSIGFVRQNDPAGIFGESLRSIVLRKAMFMTLLLPAAPTSQGQANSTISLFGALDISINRNAVRFTVKPGLTFDDGSPVLGSDISFSLKRCAGRDAIELAHKGDGSFYISGTSLPQTGTGKEAVVPLRSTDEILDLLSHCPIISRTTTRFGSTSGQMNTIISSGFYAPLEQLNVNSFVMARSLRFPGLRQNAAQKILIQEFADSEKLLSSLRSGSTDAIFLKDSAVAGRAQSDPTLRVSECGTAMLIFRRGLTASCRGGVELEKWFYERAEDRSANAPDSAASEDSNT